MRFGLGIRGKIAAVILICMIPVVVLGVFLFLSRNQARRDPVLRGHLEAARAIASDVRMFVRGAVEAERTAGAAVTSQPYPVTGVVQLFAAIRKNNALFLSLDLADPTGRVVAGDPPRSTQVTLADRPLFAALQAGREWAVGPLVWLGGHPTLELATAIRDKGRLVAVVDGMLDVGMVRIMLPTRMSAGAGSNPGASTDGVIVDGQGHVVVNLRQPGWGPDAFQTLAAVQPALAGRDEMFEGFEDRRTGTRYLGAAVPIPDLGWGAIALEPESSALESARHAAGQELLGILVAVGVGLFLAWVLGSELSAPILALVRGARAIGRGDLGTRVAVRRTDELGELGTAFNDMSQRLARHVGEMNALQAVSDAALSTVRLEELLPPLVQQVVAALQADGGMIWFVEERSGDLTLHAGFDGAPPAEARRLPRGQGLVGRVVAEARSLVVSDPHALGRLDPELLAKGGHSTAGVPLRVGGKVIGVVQVFSQHPREFTPHEVRLLETFADRVALAVDNARAYEREREIAGIIQHTLLPPPRVQLPGLAAAGRYIPSLEVGGDFYAVLPLAQGRVGIAIADVSGKGIPAATLSARARYLLEAFALDGRPPGTVLEQLNQVLAADPGSRFISLFYAVFDPGSGALAFASAGHLPPFLLRAGESAPTLLEAPGLLLGVQPASAYSTREILTGPGDLLVLFTDGITEARNPQGEQFGDQHVAGLLATLGAAPPEEVADRVIDAVMGWSGSAPADDQTVVAVRMLSERTGAPDEPGQDRGAARVSSLV